MSASIVSRVGQGIRESKSHLAKAKSAVTRAANEMAPMTAAIILLAPVVVAAVFYVWTRVSSLRIGYEISRSAELHRALLEQNRGLRIETAALRAPERLEKLAREKYRFMPPSAPLILRRRATEGAQTR